MLELLDLWIAREAEGFHKPITSRIDVSMHCLILEEMLLLCLSSSSARSLRNYRVLPIAMPGLTLFCSENLRQTLAEPY